MILSSQNSFEVKNLLLYPQSTSSDLADSEDGMACENMILILE